MPSDLTAFRDTHIYSTEATSAEIVDDLRAIRELGKSIDVRRSRYKTIFWISIVPAIFMLILTAGILTQSVIAGVIVFLIFDGTFILSIFGWRKWAKRWYDLRLVDLLDRSLAPLSRDIPANGKLKVQLDLRPREIPEKLKREGQANGWKVKYYLDSWLSLSGRFLDGSVFRLTATTKLQKRRKWKKSSSGKSKLKTKSKELTVFSLRLRFKTRKYPGVETIQNAKGAVQLPKGASIRKVKAYADEVFLAAGVSAWDNAAPSKEATTTVSGPHMIAMMFLSVYQILNLSKAIAKK